MADTINQFGKGIALNCGFDLGAKTLLDSRCVVKDKEELEAIPDIQRANGLIVWVQDDKKLMVWDEPNSQWQQVMDSDLWDVINEMIDEHNSEFHTFVNNRNFYTFNQGFSEGSKYIEQNARYEVPYTIGGLKAGTDIRNMSLRDILMSVIMPFTPPTLILYKSDKIVARGVSSKLTLGVNSLIQLNGGYNYMSVVYVEGDINVSSDVSVLIDDNEVGTIPMDYIKNEKGGLSVDFTFPDDFRLNQKHTLGVKATCEEVTDTTKPWYGWSGHEVSHTKEFIIALSLHTLGVADFTAVYDDTSFIQAISDNDTSTIHSISDTKYPSKGATDTYLSNYSFKITKGTTNRYYFHSCCPVTKMSYVDSDGGTIVLYDREAGTSQCVIGKRKLVYDNYPAFNNLIVYDYVLPQITPTADIEVIVNFASYEEIEYDEESDEPEPEL